MEDRDYNNFLPRPFFLLYYFSNFYYCLLLSYPPRIPALLCWWLVRG